MGRKILAIVTFNAYVIFLLSAFEENTAYLFDISLIKDIQSRGFEINLKEWGWGSHYIWRLFAGVVVSALCGFIAGAVAKESGAKTAALANIPSILCWGGLLYLFFSGVEVEAISLLFSPAGPGFIAISIIAIPLTTYVAYLSGGFGEEIQRQEFPDNTVLGIKGYHWIWAIFPLYWYALGIVFAVAIFVGFQIEALNWDTFSIKRGLIAFPLLFSIVAWVYPLRIVHRVLMGDLLSDYSAAARGIANFGVLLGGMFVATGIQFGAYWLVGKIYMFLT